MPSPTSYQGYPGMLARGLDVSQFPPQMELYAGDTPVTTDRGQVGSTAIEQFRSLGRNAAGLIVPWNPEARGAVGAAYATGTLTFSAAPTAADTVTVNGHVITAVANTVVPISASQYRIGTDATSAAINFVALISANVDLYGVTASNAAGVVTLTSKLPGTAGNAIATVESGTNTAFGAATLAGGTDVTAALPESVLIGFAGQPAAASGWVPYWNGGCFNYKRMIWPVNIVDLAQMQAACDGKTLTVGRVF